MPIIDSLTVSLRGEVIVPVAPFDSEDMDAYAAACQEAEDKVDEGDFDTASMYIHQVEAW